MLQKVLITLLCVKAGMIRGHGGVELHGMFFNILRQINPTLADEIHEMQQKPFSIGPLVGKIERKDGAAQIVAAKSYTFSIATFTDDLTVTLPELIQAMWAMEEIKLGGAGFKLVEAKFLQNKAYSFSQLLLSTKSLQRIQMEFVSPTCFRSKGRLLLFPEPSLVFSSLLDKWNAFSDVPIPTIGFDLIQVTKYELKTTMSQVGERDLIGFKGTCTYTFTPEAPELTRWAVHVLASFAPLSGVGYKTTVGMGQVKGR